MTAERTFQLPHASRAPRLQPPRAGRGAARRARVRSRNRSRNPFSPPPPGRRRRRGAERAGAHRTPRPRRGARCAVRSSRLACAVGAARRLDRFRRLLPATPGGAGPAQRRRHRAADGRRAALGPAGFRRRDRGLRGGRQRSIVGRASGQVSQPPGSDRRLRPAQRVTGGRRRGGRGTVGGCRRRRPRGIPVRRPHPGVGGRRRRRAVPPRTGRGNEARDHRHGQDRSARAQLRERRRCDLRGRCRRRRSRGARRAARRRYRDAPRRADDARHLEHRDRAAAVGGRRESASRGQAGSPGAHARLAPVVLRPVGQELGVPGAAEGAAHRGRPRARRGVRQRRAAEDLDERRSREFRRQRAADARARHREHPGGRGGVSDQARARRHPRYRVHRAAAAAGARAQRRPDPSARHARRSRRAGRRGIHRAGGSRRRSRGTTGCCGCSSIACSCAISAAPTSCRAREDDLRVLARSSRLADTGEQVWEQWESVKREVRDIHVRLFYRPLLSAVAALPAEERSLSPQQAHDGLRRSDSPILRVPCATSRRSPAG